MGKHAARCRLIPAILLLLIGSAHAVAGEQLSTIEPLKPFAWSDSIPEAFAKAIALPAVTSISLKWPVDDSDTCSNHFPPLLTLSDSDAESGAEHVKTLLTDVIRKNSATTPDGKPDGTKFFFLVPLDGLSDKAWLTRHQVLYGCADSVPVGGIPYKMKLSFALMPGLALDPQDKAQVALTAPDELFPYQLYSVRLTSDSPAIAEAFPTVWKELDTKYGAAASQRQHRTFDNSQAQTWDLNVFSKPPKTALTVETKITPEKGYFTSSLLYGRDVTHIAKRWDDHHLRMKQDAGRATNEQLKGKGLEGGL